MAGKISSEFNAAHYAKAFSQSSKQYGQLISVVWSEAEQKHAILYLHAPESKFSGKV